MIKIKCDQVSKENIIYFDGFLFRINKINEGILTWRTEDAFGTPDGEHNYLCWSETIYGYKLITNVRSFRENKCYLHDEFQFYQKSG